MKNEDMEKFLSSIGHFVEKEGVVIAGKLIADAIDRQTELNRKNIEMQMQMSGMGMDMMKKMLGKLDEADEGESWKKDDEDDDYN